MEKAGTVNIKVFTRTILGNLGMNQKDQGLDQQVDITEPREREANSCSFPEARKATPN